MSKKKKEESFRHDFSFLRCEFITVNFIVIIIAGLISNYIQSGFPKLCFSVFVNPRLEI